MKISEIIKLEDSNVDGFQQWKNELVDKQDISRTGARFDGRKFSLYQLWFNLLEWKGTYPYHPTSLTETGGNEKKTEHAPSLRDLSHHPHKKKPSLFKEGWVDTSGDERNRTVDLLTASGGNPIPEIYFRKSQFSLEIHLNLNK